MNDWIVRDVDTGDEWHKDSRQECEQAVDEFGSVRDLEIIPPDSEASNGTEETADANTTEVVETTPDGGQATQTQPVDDYDLPDDGPSVDEDPLVWMPDEFTEMVDGTVTITRKGFEVLAHHYNMSGGTEMVVSPVETDMEYTVHKATVTDADGDEYTAFGEAHAGDNGVENIVRMSDTRAYKRAVSRATGVGTIAIEELQNEL